MKQTLYLTLTLLFHSIAFHAAAQVPDPDSRSWDVPAWVFERIPVGSGAYQAYLDQRARRAPARPAGMPRLLSVVSDYADYNRKGATRPGDSLRFWYSAGRGMERATVVGRPDPAYLHDDRQYDSMLRYIWDMQLRRYLPASRTLRTYDSRNRLLASDESFVWGSSWMPRQEARYSYTASGQDSAVVLTVFSGGSVSSRRFVHNAAGDIASLIQSVRSNGQWYETEAWDYRYDADGRLLEITFRRLASNGQWATSHHILLSYTPSGLFESLTQQWLLSGAWFNLDRVVSRRNAAGYETARVFFASDSGTDWRLSDSFAIHSHTPSGQAVAGCYYFSSGGTMQGSGCQTNRYSNSGWLLHSETGAGTGMANRKTYDYFPGGYIRSERAETWDDTAWYIGPNDYFRRYSYDTTVAELAGTGKSLQPRLAPVPAYDRLQIQLSLPQETLSAGIFDVSGRCVRRWTFQGSYEYSDVIDVSALPVGMYSLRLQSGSQTGISRFSIIH